MNQAQVVVYIRVSTENQALSPEAQQKLCQDYCLAHNLTLVTTCNDVGVSGATPIADRPGLIRALSLLSKGSVLLATRRDRFARDVGVMADITRAVERLGASLATLECPAGDDPSGRLQRGLHDLLGAHERDVIRQRTRAALAVLRARGMRTGSVPWGYSTDPSGRLVPEPTEQAALRLMHGMHSAGSGYRSIADALCQEGYTTRQGHRIRWDRVRHLLKRVALPDGATTENGGGSPHSNSKQESSH